MENSQSKLKRQSNKLKLVKLTIKLFSVALNLKVAKAVLQKAPKEVIFAISNAAQRPPGHRGHPTAPDTSFQAL